MRNRDYDVVETMLRCGGGFVEAMAKAYRLADNDNRRRLQLAFPEYWKQYDELTTLREQKRQQAPA